MENSSELVDILLEVKQLLSSQDTDITWTHYSSVIEVISDLDVYIEALMKDSRFNLRELQIFFAPTGVLQEISMSSGWGKEFLEIAKRFDVALRI